MNLVPIPEHPIPFGVPAYLNGAYAINRPTIIDRDGFNVLFSHHQPNMAAIVIKKLYQPFSSKVSANNCVRELSILSLADHENIVKLRAKYSPDPREDELQTIYHITDYCGKTLRERIDDGRYSMSDANKWTRMMLKGVDYLNTMHPEFVKVIHRNLHPETVCIDDSGHLRIIGFGRARVLDHRRDMTTGIGAQTYSAPELILKGTGAYDETVDVWSIAAMHCEMLTGCVLFKGNKTTSEIEVMLNLLGKMSEDDLPMSDPGQVAELVEHSKEMQGVDLVTHLVDTVKPGRLITAQTIGGDPEEAQKLRVFLESTLVYCPQLRLKAAGALTQRLVQPPTPRETDRLSENHDRAIRECQRLAWDELHSPIRP